MMMKKKTFFAFIFIMVQAGNPMNILEMVKDKGINPVKVSSNKGGEYHSPCPACGGKDRFHIWPSLGGDGEFWCRNCDKAGDAVFYLRTYEGMSCGAAHAELGRECTSTTCPKIGSCRGAKGTGGGRNERATAVVRRRQGVEWQPGEAQSPEALWREHAEKLVSSAHEALLASPGILAYLERRGLPREAVENYRLGWLDKDNYRSREAWGLPTVHKDDGVTPKKLWLPKGIVIPFYVDGELHRVRIRRDEVKEGETRYYWVPGSGNDVVVINPSARAFVVVESDLDGLMVDHAAGDLVGSIPLGTCSAKPKGAAAAILEQSLCNLIALDFEPRRNEKNGRMENPGGEASRWWQKTYPRSHRWPPPKGKDPGEAYAAGVDIRAWVLAGLPPAMTIETKGAAMSPAIDATENANAFDTAKMLQLISDTRSRIQNGWDAAGWSWLEASRPDITGFIAQKENAIDPLFGEENESVLVKTLQVLEEAYRKAWAIYAERPPVIERQEALFEQGLPAAER